MSIPKIRVVQGWTNIFLAQIRNGNTEAVAANMAGVGRAHVNALVEKDPRFKEDFEKAWAERKIRPDGGVW